jgi:hypothetical protein
MSGARVARSNPSGKPLIDLALDPCDSTLAYRYWFREFAGFTFAAQMVTTIIDTLDRFELFKRY